MSEQTTNQAGNHPQAEVGIEADDLNTPMIVAIGLISTALLLVSVLGVTWLVDYSQASEVEQKVYQVPYGSAKSVLNEQSQKLNEFKAIDASAGVYSIPIDVAKKLVVAELKAERQSAGQDQEDPVEEDPAEGGE